MISKIQNSVYLTHIALLLSISILTMSFKMRGNGEVVLNAGTNIPLETVSMIQSNLVSVGQTIDFRVKYDVKVEGMTVITAGSIAKGQVMRAQRAKGLGKEGFIEIQIKSVTAVNGQEVFLTGGNVYQEGEEKQTLAILLGVFVCILFLTIKGKNAQVPPGYQVTSSVATTMTIKI
ncbi:MAG: hypothetical protein IPI23_09675 [Bacteroidetes bacterium]|jgi:hypothetical protein|nr:hypothetical protein [Bacteroidota bacterium]MBK7389311.1 hypothetical protein [Bacteroidota bacterium]MBK8415784.1 hypothetical protein [Bacteroidota bacterium]MBK9047358.1 hypothetical protein [Bacteroidota bacterium]